VTKEDEAAEKLAKSVLGVVAVPFFAPVAMCINAAVVALKALSLTWLWQWFVVEQFGLRPLPFALCGGLLLIRATIRGPQKASDLHFLWPFVYPLTTLVMGWAVHQWLM
jgi:hypothetical protein